MQPIICYVGALEKDILKLTRMLKMEEKKIDWEQRRYELAKAAMQGILSDEEEVRYACSEADYKKGEKHTVPKGIARFAIACADALINELKGD